MPMKAATTCLECGRPIKPRSHTRRGMDNACGQRAVREGRYEEYSRRIPTPEEVDAQINRYYELVESGLTATEACAEVGVPYSTMASRVTRLGLSMSGRYPTQKNYDLDALVESYWMLRADGNQLSMLLIARQLGVSDRTLYRALKNASYEW